MALLYERFDQLSEKMSKIIHLGLLLGASSFVIPKAFYCYFIYYTSNSGSAAFELPVLCWFVFHILIFALYT